MKYDLRLVATALLLFLGLNGMANAGDIEMRSLPLSGSAYSCNVINVSGDAIMGLEIFIRTSAPVLGGIGIGIVSFEADKVYGLQADGRQASAAYCIIKYAGRPGDIVASFCALDELGNCTVAIPID